MEMNRRIDPELLSSHPQLSVANQQNYTSSALHSSAPPSLLLPSSCSSGLSFNSLLYHRGSGHVTTAVSSGVVVSVFTHTHTGIKQTTVIGKRVVRWPRPSSISVFCLSFYFSRAFCFMALTDPFPVLSVKKKLRDTSLGLWCYKKGHIRNSVCHSTCTSLVLMLNMLQGRQKGAL